MFTIKWGTDKQKVLNSNCQVINLVQHIQKLIGHENEEIDLAEESSGYLQFLKEVLGEYASLLLKPRGVYIPVVVKGFLNDLFP